MKIHLVRHGEPAFEHSRTVGRDGFRSALDDYAGAPLERSRPPRTVLDLLDSSGEPLVVSSELVRARQSAERLSAERPGLPELMSSPLLDEAALPHPDTLLFPVPWNIALPVFRLAWLLGYSRNANGIAADRKRSAEAADWLEGLARAHREVFSLGHGVMHTMIARRLGERGWSAERVTGSGYWSCRTMRCRRAEDIGERG